MPDITTTQIFSDGEKGITATKMNNIIANSVIQPDFVTAKPSSSTLDPTDQLLEVKGAGTYARITGQQLIDSVSASVTQNITPTITAVRLRSFNAVGNPTFECDQKTGGALVSNITAGIIDRWQGSKVGTMIVSGQQLPSSPPIVVPGTNFAITSKFLRLTLTTAQAALGATDQLAVYQIVEASRLRELISDVHSCSLLVRSSVSGLNFGLSLRDNGGIRSLAKLCTIPSANVWTLIPLPNLPIWSSGATWGLNPGQLGYYLTICLSAGSSYIAPANDTWQNGVYIGAAGQDSFTAKAVNSTFDLAFVQHEPGAQCTTPMDCPFTQNLDDCLRYYQKSCLYSLSGQTTNTSGMVNCTVPASQNPLTYVPFKKTMAKTPTIAAWSPTTGTANAVRDNSAGVDRVISGTLAPGDNGYGGHSLSTTNAASTVYQWHFIADTGW
jgi:hypothetical protein